MGTENRPLLRLVHDRDVSGNPIQSQGHFEPMQESLLASGHRTLFICTTDSLDEISFTKMFFDLTPKFAFDLRVSPRFDFGHLNRKRVLTLFETLDVSYRDFGSIYQSDEFDSEFQAVLTSPQVSTGLMKDLKGRIAIALVDANPEYRNLGLRLGRLFRQATGEDWEVVLKGPSDTSVESRKRIFISHANPQDNNFVLWLQAQLARRGFEVWSDLVELGAGDVFWDKIENIIRTSAARVIVVISRVAMTKPGVLDEIALAVSIERAQGIEGFVIPIRIDDTPFSDFRANIARKNTIDFSAGWAKGFNQVVETLKRDRIPQMQIIGESDVNRWLDRQRDGRAKLRRIPETLISNQLRIQQLPKNVFCFSGTPKFEVVAGDSANFQKKLPLIPFQGQWLSLFSASDLTRLAIEGLTFVTEITFEKILTEQVALGSALRTEDRERLVVRLLNRHWDYFLFRLGLLEYQTAQGAPTMYVPKGLIDKDQAEFVGLDGKKRKRILVGRSEKRSVNWNLGVIGRFKKHSDHYVLHLRMRVVFTEDGLEKLVSNERMKMLRRSFCKNWWNDRWSSLQSAFLAFLSDGNEVINLVSNETQLLQLSSFPITYELPYSIDEEVKDNVEIEDEGDVDFGNLVEEMDEWQESDVDVA